MTQFWKLKQNSWLHLLNKAKNKAVNAKSILFHLLQARIYDELGFTIERNACAAECCEILQRQPMNCTRSSLFVL